MPIAQLDPGPYSRGWTPFAGGLVTPAEPATVARRLSAPGQTLSEREIEIVQLLAEGLADKEIAGRLFLSPRTVHTHVGSALRKTDSRSRTQLAVRHVKETFGVGA
jgi:DNA-binding NarL/FixJ family response regulator